jgi:hypothetical protein
LREWWLSVESRHWSAAAAIGILTIAAVDPGTLVVSAMLMRREAMQARLRLESALVEERFRKFSFLFRRQGGKQEQNQFAKKFAVCRPPADRNFIP